MPSLLVWIFAFAASPPRLQQAAVPDFPCAGCLGRVSVCLVMGLCWGSFSAGSRACAQAAWNDLGIISDWAFLLLRPPRASETASQLFTFWLECLKAELGHNSSQKSWGESSLFMTYPDQSRVRVCPWAPTARISGIWAKTWIRKEICTRRFGIQIKASTPGICTSACLVPFRGSFCLSVPPFPYLQPENVPCFKAPRACLNRCKHLFLPILGSVCLQ